jgi:hypothetical protein
MLDNKSLDQKIRVLRKKVDACDRLAAKVLVRIQPLPIDHPERRAAVGEVLALRRRGREASSELAWLLRLRDTPIDGMCCA